MITIESLQQLGDNVNVQLTQLANANHCGAGTLQLAVDGSELMCRIHSTDRLACEVESIHVSAAKLRTLDKEERKTLAQQLTQKLSYLEERLVLVEMDELAVQVRSETPHINSDSEKSYFELLVGHKGLALHRYRKAPDTERQVVPATMTRSVLCRVLGDLALVSIDS